MDLRLVDFRHPDFRHYCNCFVFREGLPHDYLSYMGVANLESANKKREAFNLKVKNLFNKLFSFASPDLAADQVLLEQQGCVAHQI